jgi:hypothetical protein
MYLFEILILHFYFKIGLTERLNFSYFSLLINYHYQLYEVINEIPGLFQNQLILLNDLALIHFSQYIVGSYLF